MRKFKVNDTVKPKVDAVWDNYIFRVTRLIGTNVSCYSVELAKDRSGHDGSFSKTELEKLNIPVGSHGHWNYHYEELVLLSDGVKKPVEEELVVGDWVKIADKRHRYSKYTFEILEITCLENYRCFSLEMAEDDEGHCGGAHINGIKKGHLSFTKNEIIKIVNNEVFRENPEGCPGGIESKVHSEPIKIASGSRFVGSGTTACRIGIKIGVGAVNLNWVQPN